MQFMTKKLTLGSLYAGVGGIYLGVKNAYKLHNRECIFIMRCIRMIKFRIIP